MLCKDKKVGTRGKMQSERLGMSLPEGSTHALQTCLPTVPQYVSPQLNTSPNARASVDMLVVRDTYHGATGD